MVIDESTATAVLKRDCKIFHRREKELALKYRAKRSRKAWLNSALDILNSTSYLVAIVRLDDDKRYLHIWRLSPEENGNFSVCYGILDTKKCDISESYVKLNLTKHFIVRVMQMCQSTCIEDIRETLFTVIDELNNLAPDFERGVEYEIYIKDIGLVPTSIKEDNTCIVKTLVPINLLSDHQKKYLT